MEFLLGVLIGALLYYIFAERKKSSGTFIIDLTNNELCKVTMYENLNDVYFKDRIILDVKIIDDEDSPN